MNIPGIRPQFFRSTLLPLICCAAGAGLACGELLVYEPFDYESHNDEVFGRLEGRNGGLGFAAPWEDTDGRDNEGHAFIFDSQGNPEDLYDGGWGQGKPSRDGVVDNLPTMGNYVGGSDWNGSGDRINSDRKLARSAGEMARDNGGVLWLSAVWHFPGQSFFAPVAIALTSKNGGIQGRGHLVTNQGDGIGAGNGRDFRNGRKRLNAMCWQKGNNVAHTAVADPSGSKDNIIVLKYEFGKPKLPFAIATTGHGGMSVTPEKRLTLAGQLAVADPGKYPEFAGNVFTVDSRPFQRTVEESVRNDGSHWNNNGETLWKIGKGMGDGMADMLDGK